jgi:CMP-N-acetylneuraminic acid synthetase
VVPSSPGELTTTALALITARGGSKGIPGKNLVELGGRPLIAWTLEAAADSKCVSRVLVSTDSEEIAAVAKEYGGWVPFLRPARLSHDTATSADAIAHAVDWLQRNEPLEEDWLVLLQPTSPFRTGRHIDEALRRAVGSGAEAVVAMRSVRDHPEWLWREDAEGFLQHLTPKDSRPTMRQALAKYFVPCGALYAVREARAKEGSLWWDVPTVSFEVDGAAALDIDEPFDLEVARALVLAWSRRETSAT